MGCRVTSVERVPELATTARARLARLGYGDRVEVRVGDGSAGDPARAGSGATAGPAGGAWPRIRGGRRAGRPGGADRAARRRRPAGDPGRAALRAGAVLVERDGERLRTSNHGACVFVPLIGEGGFRWHGRPPAVVARRSSVYSPGHDPRLRRPPPRRCRALVRRPDREPARARPERHDPDGLLRQRRGRRPHGLPARGARLREQGDLADDRGLQPREHRRRPAARAAPTRRTWPNRRSSTRPRPRPTRPPSASGSARRGTGARTSTTGPWPASRSRTTCPSRAPS